MLPLFAGACASIKTENKVETVSEIKPIEVKPIHIILDINVKVDKDLDKFFPETGKQSPAASPKDSAAQEPAKPVDHDPATPQVTALTPEQQAEKEATKARFAQRLPVITDLKKRGIVAENNKGFLQFMGEIKEHEDVVGGRQRRPQSRLRAHRHETRHNPGPRRPAALEEERREGVPRRVASRPERPLDPEGISS